MNRPPETPAARFKALEKLAVAFFETDRWKTAFCRRYHLTPQTLTGWRLKGPQGWAVQAMADALRAKQLGQAMALVMGVAYSPPDMDTPP